MTPVVQTNARRARSWLGVLLLVVGFLCHYFAARAIGGTYIAYRDHIFGFVLLTLVSGAFVGVLGWRFWRARPDFTILIIGALQALIGVWIYTHRFSVHG
jgi:uncharacterized membrane protein HdeD (DUF308 family)